MCQRKVLEGLKNIGAESHLAYIVYELGVQQLGQIWESMIDFIKSMEDGSQKKLKMVTFTKVLK